MAECTGLENRQGKPSWVQIPRPPPALLVGDFITVHLETPETDEENYGITSSRSFKEALRGNRCFLVNSCSNKRAHTPN